MEAGGQQPAGLHGLARVDVAQVDRQGWGHRVVLHLGADDLEVDQQALFVFDDLGLGRGDGQVLGQAVAPVAPRRTASVYGIDGSISGVKGSSRIHVPLVEVLHVAARDPG